MTQLTAPSLEDLARPTRLADCPAIARLCGVARVFAKLESERPLGNFKSLGGLTAGLRALARAAKSVGSEPLPPLICASDGNHGLAVAAGARAGGGQAIIYLHEHVEPVRARRIEHLGATIRWIEGTYDDAVEAAVRAARAGTGILVPDTSADPHDPVVGDVILGYRQMADELLEQLPELTDGPSHLFVQAGVGGLAAALADGLFRPQSPIRVCVVEPEAAACVAHALATGRVERVSGNLRTEAEMLSCGVASASAMSVLRRHDAQSLLVSEADLREAVQVFEQEAGIATTPSGAAGLAGLLAVTRDSNGGAAGVTERSEILLIVTEGTVRNR